MSTCYIDIEGELEKMVSIKIELASSLQYMVEQYVLAMKGCGLKESFIESNSELIKARAALERAKQ